MKRIRFSFFSELTRQGWVLSLHDAETLREYARQAGFSTQEDAHLAGELVLSALVAVGGELKSRGEWREAPLD